MKTYHIKTCGIVQGVGFRPFVSRTADALGIKGTVANRGSYVEIFAQCSEKALNGLLSALANDPPERAVILDTECAECDCPPFEDFQIIESEKESGDIFVSPDIAVCEKCKRELYDKSDRRYLHPFINCTQCGPRLTIMDTMPYDRERTTMADFPMCPKCAAEYTNPATRRYDAQPVCCNDCGPEVYIIGTDLQGREAITAARRKISEGGVIAVKGIGGFHLCCDAKNSEAVARLRQLKHRPMKPFAVMMKNEDTARRECIFTEAQEKIMTGHQKPILLLDKRPGGELCGLIAPGNSKVGVMLPYAPVQLLLFDYDDGISVSDCLVMTSGNASGAPICRSDEDAVSEISGFCDLILSHNRRILIRSDDTVMDTYRGKPYMIRRSRGYAPLPVMTESRPGCVLAIGGELKNTFCICKDGLMYPSSYVGDMADIRTVAALKESVRRMLDLLEAKPQLIVCDLHPGYNTTAAAEELAEELKLPMEKVQHHYAHILSCMAENKVTGRVIGLSLDGTGYGTDGSIWGGEILLSDETGFERAGSIAPFIHAGGDAASREGFRIAASMLSDICGDRSAEVCSQLSLCSEKELGFITMMRRANINCTPSTSCGRLFDAVSAILGIRRASTFESEAAMALQTYAEQFKGELPALTVPEIRRENGRLILPTDGLVKLITEQRLAGAEVNMLAYAFHAMLAEMLVKASVIIREETGINLCALSGGVFQNTLLTSLTESGLEAAGFEVITHSLIPPNDGGLCLGQALYGAQRLDHKE